MTPKSNPKHPKLGFQLMKGLVPVKRLKVKRKKSIFKIMSKENREALYIAFADEGYKVRCFEKQTPQSYPDTIYYVEVTK